jgi:hypothetical protein
VTDWFRRATIFVFLTLVGCVAPKFAHDLSPAEPSRERVLSQARDLIGSERANTLVDLLERNVPDGVPMANSQGFGSRHAELEGVEQWLDFIRVVQVSRSRLEAMTIQNQAVWLEENAPFPLETGPFFEHRAELRHAAQAANLPIEVLAAIVDNEQSGARLAFGLSGVMRVIADRLALTEARATGRSSVMGGFSSTLGLAQMSWRDAIQQRARLRAMHVRFGSSFPTSELEMRAVLERPGANLMLTASRLRGYLNASLNRPRLDLRDLPRGWVSLEGPLWHNRPDLARTHRINAYGFHAFFKACLYAVLLEDERPNH